MERYNYYEEVKNDIRYYIEYDADINYSDYETLEDLESALYDDLWTVDGVTGNASGSYTFSTWQAEEYIMHNLDLLAEALEEFGCENYDVLKQGAEACDVTIRCYVLGQVLGEVIQEFEEEFNAAHENGEG